jgi:hypothetical protein
MDQINKYTLIKLQCQSVRETLTFKFFERGKYASPRPFSGGSLAASQRLRHSYATDFTDSSVTSKMTSGSCRSMTDAPIKCIFCNHTESLGDICTQQSHSSLSYKLRGLVSSTAMKSEYQDNSYCDQRDPYKLAMMVVTLLMVDTVDDITCM